MKNIMRSVRVWIGIIFIMSLIAVRAAGVHQWLTFAWLHNQHDVLLGWISEKPITAALLYISAYALAVMCALPLMSIMTIIGGFLFGVFYGALYANIGATIGAIMFFSAVRFLIGDFLQKAYHAQLHQFNEYIEQFGAWYFLAVRCIIVVPFFLVNLLAGLTTVSLATFIWTTSLGIIPISIVLAFAGTELASIQSVSDVCSTRIIAALSAIGALGLLSILVQYILHKKKGV